MYIYNVQVKVCYLHFTVVQMKNSRLCRLTKLLNLTSVASMLGNTVYLVLPRVIASSIYQVCKFVIFISHMLLHVLWMTPVYIVSYCQVPTMCRELVWATSLLPDLSSFWPQTEIKFNRSLFSTPLPALSELTALFSICFCTAVSRLRKICSGAAFCYTYSIPGRE